jgi:cell division septal protein FtsQ
VVKIAGILTARFARNRYRRKTEEEKKKFWQRIGRHRLKFWLLMASMGGAGLGYAITHLERTPLTRRLR